MAAKGITIIGLGPGKKSQITLEAWEILSSIEEIYLRTNQHPLVKELPQSLKIRSFDSYYQEEKDFPSVYQRIIEKILELGKSQQGVVYAVPGHPYVAETTAPKIVEKAKALNIPVKVIEGLSFLGPIWTAVGLDPLPQTAILDALDLIRQYHPKFPPDSPALIAQVYSARIASDVKLTLMNAYPDDHPVYLVHAAGTDQEIVEDIPLYEIDRSPHLGLLSSLYVTPLEELSSFESFQNLVAHLRSPEGCPWDREQTHQSLRRNIIEEAYETADAIDSEDPLKLQEELGDLLLQIVLQSQIAWEEGEFNLSNVLHTIQKKLIYRHPHVFGDIIADNPEVVLENWEKLKARERKEKGENEFGLLDSVPKALPALSQAEIYQKRASTVGFEWPDINMALEKVHEEMQEICAANSQEEKEKEMGDLLLAMVNVARWMKIDPEQSLRGANKRFLERFRLVEEAARTKGKTLKDMEIQELLFLWEEAKYKTRKK
ncbi:MAG: nucleoside triphosphate pyrophosphohydrolase [Anaerolineales bacterium]|nr:nucleoside triphosphate pyrophosphohydrolase [Anaerolineales bacterium]